MRYYIVTFLSVLINAALADKMFKKHKNKLGILFLFFSGLFFCITAGIRGDSVGTDIRFYAASCFKKACMTNSLKEFFELVTIEPGYGVLAFLVSRFADNLGWFLFWSQALVVYTIYYSLYLVRKNASFFCGTLLYAFWFYCFSLNIMRQSIACAFVMLSFCLWLDKKKKGAVITGIIAFLFHRSALIGIMIWGVAIYANSTKRSLSNFRKVIIFMALGVCIFSFSKVLSVIGSIGLISQDYLQRMSSTQGEDTFTVIEYLLRGTIIFFPYAIFLLVRRNIGVCFSKDENLLHTQSVLSYIILIGFILSFARNISTYIIRIGYYCNYFSVLLVAIFAERGLSRENNRRVFIIIEFIVCVIYWYIIYVKFGWHEVMPFVTRF